MTLEWLINDTELNNLKCVAGKENLNAPILSVNILDNPDVIRWIKKDELVLTTGYLLKDDAEAQINIIRELKETGCCALGIKIKRFFQTIPEIMIKEAEKVGLTLIEIPFYYSFSEIIKIIYNKIYSGELNDDLLQYSIINKISSAFFENQGLNVMINELSYFIEKSILITDLDYNVISSTFTLEYKYLLNSINLLEVSPTETNSYINYTEVSNSNYCNLKINDEVFRFFIITLPNFSGILCVLIDNSDISSYNKLLLEKAKHIISLELIRSDKVKDFSNSYHNFFFDFLVSDNEKSEKDILEICNLYDFNYKKKRVCISFVLENCESDQHKNKIINTLQQVISNSFIDYKDLFICTSNNILTVFIFFKIEQNNTLVVNNTYNIISDLYTKLCGIINCNINIGISRCHSGLNSIRTAFKDTLNAINLNKNQNNSNNISCYTDKYEYHLLSTMPETYLQKLCDDTISPLIEFDENNNGNLIDTLKTYYLNKFNSTDTSKQLFLHRNTLIHRLDKIKELLLNDFTDSNKMFSIYLGICAYEILNN